MWSSKNSPNQRDFLYIDDAVEAILLSALGEKAIGEVFNVGRDVPSNFLELTETIISIAGTGKWEFAPFSPERAAQEPGHFYSDITKIRNTLGWQPKTDLEAGLQKTIDFYQANRRHYWE